MKVFPSMGRSLVAFILLALVVSANSAREDDSYARARESLLREISADVVATSRELGKNKLDPSVLKAMRQVERHLFVPSSEQPYAYQNRPLPIGFGQTISQPYIVAIMTDLLNVGPGDKVLEVGTGSGYQAAVLAKVAGEVYSVEIVPQLAKSATERLRKLGYDNVRVKQADGYYGWKEHAPFDAIMVTAAAGQIPPPLVQQLEPGGRMLIPVGGPFSTQYLILVQKTKDGKVTTRQILPVRFVPLTGKH